MFESIRIINLVYEACYACYSEKGSFNAKLVMDKLDLPSTQNKEDAYWQKKNVTNSLNILEKAKLISGVIKPEYTSKLGLLKEVRYGSITKLGAFLPRTFRAIWICIYLAKQKILAILGVLSFVKLANNAYVGVTLVSGWIENLAVLIILYILYLLILRIID